MNRILFFVATLILTVESQDPHFYTMFTPHDGKYPCYRQVNYTDSLKDFKFHENNF